jgi:hypothetical protein
MDNLNHPADKLAEVKEEIKKLKKIEMSLKDCLLEMPESDRVGRYFKARVNERAQKRLNRDLLNAEVNQNILDRCFIEQSVNMLTLSKV